MTLDAISRDRAPERAQIVDALRAGRLCILTGSQGFGKTTLINTITPSELSRSILRTGAQYTLTEETAITDIGQPSGLTFKRREELEHFLHSKAPIALIVDDAEYLLGHDWTASFMDWLCHLPERTNGGVSVLLVGWAGLDNYARLIQPEQHVPLRELSDEAILQLFGSDFSKHPTIYQKTSIKFARESPHLIRIIPIFFQAEGFDNQFKSEETLSMFFKQIFGDVFNHSVPGLPALSKRLYQATGRFWQSMFGSSIMAPYPVIHQRGVTPDEYDIVIIEAIFETNQVSRAAFVFKGSLSKEFADRLNQLRVSGYPIMPLSEGWMLAALADENTAGLLRAHEQRYFEGYNLFNHSNSITDQGLFFGRIGLLNGIGGALRRQNSVLVTGQRKIGKTSVLHMLRQKLASGPWCWVDLQALAPDEDWRQFVFSEIIRAVDRWGESTQPAGEPWPFPPCEPATVSELRAAMVPRLDQMAARGLPRQVFLVLDEIERILPTENRPERARAFVDLTAPLRALAQGPDRWLTIIAADLRPTVNRVNRLPNGETNPLYRFFQEQPLSLFSPEETETMIRSIAALMGSTVSAGVAETIHQRTGGHPYLSRVLAGYAYEARDGNELDATALAHGMEEADRRWELGDFFEQNVWTMLTANEQALILHVAQSGQPADLRPPKRLAIPTGRWRRAVRDLQDQGLIDREGSLAIASLSEWLEDEGLLQRTAS